nr:hypothetical protein [Lachnospiraceae bacterium]
NKRNSADISVSVSYNGETIDPKLYDVKFHNNKDVSNGKKEPYFVISLKKKAGAQSSVRKEFRGTKIEFTIVPADLSEIELSTTKIVSKKKGIKVSKLTATIDSLKLKLKQSKSSGKGDFTVTGYTDSNKNAVSVNGINNYKGTAIVKSK